MSQRHEMLHMKLWIDLPEIANMKTLITQINNILKVMAYSFQEYDHALIKIVAIFFESVS